MQEIAFAAIQTRGLDFNTLALNLKPYSLLEIMRPLAVAANDSYSTCHSLFIRELNPRYQHTFLDEDLMGRLKCRLVAA